MIPNNSKIFSAPLWGPAEFMTSRLRLLPTVSSADLRLFSSRIQTLCCRIHSLLPRENIGHCISNSNCLAAVMADERGSGWEREDTVSPVQRPVSPGNYLITKGRAKFDHAGCTVPVLPSRKAIEMLLFHGQPLCSTGLRGTIMGVVLFL